MTQVIGLTGPVQNGKIQLTPVFQECGWQFHDLNDAVYGRREKGSDRYRAYQKIIPGCLDDEGVETGVFYRDMKPAVYKSLLAQDVAYVGNIARQHYETARIRSEKAVLSWEYLARIEPALELDHVLIFTSDKSVWFKRMQQRAAELGFDPPPSNEVLTRIVNTLDVQPETIRQEVYRRFPPEIVTEIDVSDDDWGASRLREFLENL